MSSNVLILFAIFGGETAAQGFPSDSESSKTLVHLKSIIKRENPRYLRDVHARNQQIRWGVYFPVPALTGK